MFLFFLLLLFLYTTCLIHIHNGLRLWWLFAVFAIDTMKCLERLDNNLIGVYCTRDHIVDILKRQIMNGFFCGLNGKCNIEVRMFATRLCEYTKEELKQFN